jgi:hypothetical protein
MAKALWDGEFTQRQLLAGEIALKKPVNGGTTN